MRELLKLFEAQATNTEADLGARMASARAEMTAAREALVAAEQAGDWDSLGPLDAAREAALAEFNAAEDAIGNHFMPEVEHVKSDDEARALMARIPISVSKAYVLDALRQKGFDGRVVRESTERTFRVCEIQGKSGVWKWFYAVSNPLRPRLMWQGPYTSIKGACTAAARRNMNPNVKSGFTSAFFANPTISAKIPYGPGNPFYED